MGREYDQQSYWHDRFESERSFEWLVSSEAFLVLLAPYLGRLGASARILQLGSGTSDLHNHLRRRGFRNVTNVDYEARAVERGRQLEEAAFGAVEMEYVVADATRLDLPGAFDLVVDKSTADAISCGGEDAVARMCSSVKKCLADGGVWISMSYSASRFEAPHPDFEVEVIAKIPTPKQRRHDPDVYHWCYLLRPRALNSVT